MQVDYTSPHCVEISGPKDTYNETEVIIELNCSARSIPASYSPVDGGDPGSAAEFEIAGIHIQLADNKIVAIELSVFEAFMGEEIAKQILDNAYQDAEENGDF